MTWIRSRKTENKLFMWPQINRKKQNSKRKSERIGTLETLSLFFNFSSCLFVLVHIVTRIFVGFFLHFNFFSRFPLNKLYCVSLLLSKHNLFPEERSDEKKKQEANKRENGVWRVMVSGQYRYKWPRIWRRNTFIKMVNSDIKFI